MQLVIIIPLSPGMTPELEIILAEGAGMEPGYSSDKVSISVFINVTHHTHDHHHQHWHGARLESENQHPT